MHHCEAPTCPVQPLGEGVHYYWGRGYITVSAANLPGATLDRAGHRAVARPLLRVRAVRGGGVNHCEEWGGVHHCEEGYEHLRVREVRHGVEVGHDELAARVLVDAQLRVPAEGGGEPL